MAYIASKSPSKSLLRRLYLTARPLSLSSSSTDAAAQSQKLHRIADELLDLSNLEKHDYSVLFTHKMGLHRYIRSVSALSPASAPASPAAEPKTEKTAFDVRLEKFDAGAKIKIIKEVRSFTDLGLKEAKDLVEKAPVVVKKGLTKEEAESIVEKLKGLGATVVLE